MAQYRAIFQNAYFKGLATAAVVTMAMAAGQAQAASPGKAAYAAGVTTTETTITIDGADVADTGALNNLANYSTIGIAAEKDDSGKTIKITAGTADPSTGNYIKSDGAAADTKYTADTLILSGGSLAISGNTAANKTATAEFTNKVDIVEGTLLLNSGGANASAANLLSKEINVGDGSSANDTAQLQLSKLGTVGKTINATDVFSKLNTINLKSGGTIKTVINNENDEGTIHVGNLNITGGDLISTTKSTGNASGSLTVNIVKGQMTAGSLQTDHANAKLNINFKKALTAANGAAETNKLALTGGSISGAGEIVVSGDTATGTKGTLILQVKSGDTAGVNLESASGNLKIASGAIFETNKANLDALVGSKLKTTISGGTLKFIETTNIDLDKNKFGTDGTGNKIGLTSNATILGKEFTLTDNIGAVTVEANTINLKNPTGTALTTTGVKALSTLNVGADSKVQSVTLSAGDLKAINDAHANDGPNMDNNIKADALAQTGSFGTLESVSEGKLTIDGDGSKLDVVNGTWTNNNVYVVLGGTNEATLTVGKDDPTYNTAAKLVFDNGSKLEIKKGTVTVGNDSSDKVLGAELDISALEGENLVFTSGSFTAASGGTIVVNQDFIDKLVDTNNTNRQALISSGGMFEVAESLEIDADKLHSGSATANKLAFNGASGKLATLKSDSVTINKATGTSVNIGEFGAIEANTLTLNNDVDGNLEDVKLDSGSFIVKQTLTSDGSTIRQDC